MPFLRSRAARGVAVLGVIAAAGLVHAMPDAVAARQAQTPPCPERPVLSVASSSIPADVCIPDGFVDVPVDYFDDYSWKTLVAMIWPAAPGKRGVPDATRKPGAPGPTVFETYKSLWETFHEDASVPNANFNTYEGGAHNACGAAPRFGELVIASKSGIDDIGQAGNAALDGPLVAQNGKYVRYLTLFNQVQFDHIIANKLYSRKDLPAIPTPRPATPVVDFPDGSVAIKSAWIEVDGLNDAIVRRMYTREAIVKKAGGATCSRVRVGLVGLHIVQKTPSRPQWIWTSFEHEDNVPPARPNGPGVFTFNDGTRTPMPKANPLLLSPLAPEPVTPFNVTRFEPMSIHPLTVLMNFRYQDLLPDTVWRHYKLVTTQWPRLNGNQAVPVPADLDGSVPHTFPGVVAFSAFTNITMETFDQERVQLGCMNCHNRVRMSADFIWSVANHAYPSVLTPASHTIR